MKLLKTKTAAFMLAEGLTKITIWPVLKVVDKVSDKYSDTKAKLEVSWIKKNLSEMSPQDKFNAAVNHRSEMAWVNDPIIDAATTVLHCVSKGNTPEYVQRFEIAYAYLRSNGVEILTPAIDAYYMLNINKITV